MQSLVESFSVNRFISIIYTKVLQSSYVMLLISATFVYIRAIGNVVVKKTHAAISNAWNGCRVYGSENVGVTFAGGGKAGDRGGGMG